MKKSLVYILIGLCAFPLLASTQQTQKQATKDNDDIAFNTELDPIIISDKIDANDLIKHLKNDTTFYKAFKNLNVLGYKAIINGKMYDRKGDEQKASIKANMVQTKSKNCTTRKLENQEIKGKLKDKNGEYLFYTCKVFGSLFLDEKTECGQSNVIGNKEVNVDNYDGIDKRVEQIKKLVFNPGQRIPGLFFFGNKVAIFEGSTMKRYNYDITKVIRNGKDCVKFEIKAKDDLNVFQRSDIVIDELTTWLDAKTWEIVAKKYTLSYDFGLISFYTTMEVDVEKYKGYLHPSNIRYSGKWSVPFYKKEDGVFTVLLHSFTDKDQ